MTKLVPLGSIEHGIREALRHLSDDGASAAIEAYSGQRKSSSLLRKCADPDDERHHIQLRDAIALDRACMEQNHPPPLLRSHSNLLEQPPPPRNSDADFCHLAMAIRVATGQVSEAFIRSDDCDECACPKGYHTRDVLLAIEELEHAVAELRSGIAARSFDD